METADQGKEEKMLLNKLISSFLIIASEMTLRKRKETGKKLKTS
jgi:hypothetical protein